MTIKYVDGVAGKIDSYSSLDKVIDDLQTIREIALKDGYTNLNLDIEAYDYYGSLRVIAQVTGRRPQTKQEEAKDKARDEAQKAAEMEQLARLKAKYEGK